MKKKLRFADIKGASSEEIENYLTENLLSDKVEATPLDRAIETGLRYLDQSNYRMATTYFKNALEKADDRFDKAYIYRALAITSLRSEEDINEAFGYANEAYSRANNPANDYLVAYIQYKMNDESACLERLERIMHDYPKLKSAYSSGIFAIIAFTLSYSSSNAEAVLTSLILYFSNAETAFSASLFEADILYSFSQFDFLSLFCCE